jgi:hypothetical protein
MFTRSFLVGRTRVLGRAVSLVLALGLLLALAGCPMENDDDEFVDDHKLSAMLIGTWEDPTYGDKYEIAATTVTQYSMPYTDPDTETAYPSTPDPGIIEFISNFSSDSGVIIIKYDTARGNGRTYGAVYYQELKTEGGATSAKMSSAGRYDKDHNYADITPVITTLEDAKGQFTRDNGDGYYVGTWGGPYVKQ